MADPNNQNKGSNLINQINQMKESLLKAQMDKLQAEVDRIRGRSERHKEIDNAKLQKLIAQSDKYKSQKELFDNQKNVAPVGKLVKNLGNLTYYVNRLIFETTGLREAIQEADEFQIKALSLNRDFKSVLGNNVDELQKFPGSLDKAIGTKIEALDVGFRDVSDDLINLGVSAKLTHQDSMKMLNVLKTNQVVGKLTNIQTDALSKTILRSARENNVRAEKLVDALENLTENLLDFGSFGVGDKFSEAVTELTAKLGGSDATTRLLSQFVKEITETGFDAVSKLALAGGPEAVSLSEAFWQDPTAKNLEKLLKVISVNSKKQFDIFTKQNRQGGLGVYQDVFGKLPQIAQTLESALSKARSEPTDEGQKNLANSLENFRKAFYDPIRKLVYSVFPTILNFLTEHAAIFRAIGTAVGIFATIGTIAGAFKSISKVIGLLGSFLGKFNVWGLAIAAALAGLTQFLMDDADSTDKLAETEDERLKLEEDLKRGEDENRARITAQQLQKDTNSYLKLTSDNLNMAMERIRLGNDVSKEIKGLNASQLGVLEQILIFMKNQNIAQPTPILSR